MIQLCLTSRPPITLCCHLNNMQICCVKRAGFVHVDSPRLSLRGIIHIHFPCELKGDEQPEKILNLSVKSSLCLCMNTGVTALTVGRGAGDKWSDVVSRCCHVVSYISNALSGPMFRVGLWSRCCLAQSAHPSLLPWTSWAVTTALFSVSGLWCPLDL